MSNNLSIENAKIVFRNFEGKEGRFNPAGKRNFCVLLDDDIAEKLIKDGWNVRWLQPRNPDDDKKAYIQVAVRFDNFPPRVVMITSKNKTNLSEDDVKMLDWVEIANVDLVINPSAWNVNGKKGVKAYLKSIYVTIQEDEFAQKYKNLPDETDIPFDVDD